jgi:hypothetical protein
MFFFSFLLLLSFNQLNELISYSVEFPLEKRIEIISSALLDIPFKESSIGEEEGYDKDPLINLEYIDCVTFIEYILAFVNSRHIEEFKKHIISIRYKDNKIRFEDRLHLPDFQWFPNAQKKGYLIDITREIGGKYYKSIYKEQKKDFYIEGKRIDKSRLVEEKVTIFYISKEDLDKIYNFIPEYSIIRVLREDSIRPYLTTHIGMVVKKGNKKFLRHSSRHFGHKVTDTSLKAYFSTFEKYENWKALGIAIYRIGIIKEN